MTISETILGYPGLKGLSTEMVDKVCIDRDITKTAEYAAGLKKSVNLAIADCLIARANDPDYTEGDQSEKYPREQMIAEAHRLYRENGEAHRVNRVTIRNRTNIW